jgi:hypothetical protein
MPDMSVHTAELDLGAIFYTCTLSLRFFVIVAKKI